MIPFPVEISARCIVAVEVNVSKIGRNDPCPCGSGRKYKKCCLAKDRAAAAPSLSFRTSQGALEWLLRHYQEEFYVAFDEYVGMGGDAFLDSFAELPDGLREMVFNNAHEWLLADGDLWLEERDIAVSKLLLGDDGPRFTAEERAWLEVLVSRPLGVYEVLEVKPGEGVRLRDLLHDDEPPLWVLERTASQTLVRWDVLGARVLPLADGMRFSGALYPLDRRRLDVPSLLDDLRAKLAWEATGDPEAERDLLAIALPSEWLSDIGSPMAPPELVDAATGDPLLLVTDRYRVRNWGRLEQALAARPDVDGDWETGWTRFEELDDGQRRLLLGLNPRRGGRLETFARTRSLADVGRGWLEAVAGDAVEFRDREVVDPKDVMADARGRSAPRRDDADAMPMTSEIMESIYRQHYDGWIDMEIGVLGERTPREAMETEEGRQAVIDLLKQYESGEERKARMDHREPVSLEYLWQRMGLDREAELAPPAGNGRRRGR